MYLKDLNGLYFLIKGNMTFFSEAELIFKLKINNTDNLMVQLVQPSIVTSIVFK